MSWILLSFLSLWKNGSKGSVTLPISIRNPRGRTKLPIKLNASARLLKEQAPRRWAISVLYWKSYSQERAILYYYRRPIARRDWSGRWWYISTRGEYQVN